MATKRTPAKATKAAAKPKATTSKQCDSSTRLGQATLTCTQPAGHDGRHTGPAGTLTWR